MHVLSSARKISKLSEYITLRKINQVELLDIHHPKFKATIAIYGAQLLSWKPAHTKHDVFYLSENNTFEQGVAIRGGVPISFPWFARSKSPFHGTVRIQDWKLVKHTEDLNEVTVSFEVVLTKMIARITFTFTDTCKIQFSYQDLDETQYQAELQGDTSYPSDVQAMLHTYFGMSSITKTAVLNVPNAIVEAGQVKGGLEANAKLTTAAQEHLQQYGVACSELQGLSIIKPIDLVSRNDQDSLAPKYIYDHSWHRVIEIKPLVANSTVLWNPGMPGAPLMQLGDYQHMLCLETGYLDSERFKLVKEVAVEYRILDQCSSK